MRFLVKVSIPTEAGNRMIKRPDFADAMKSIVAELKPEASYYLALEGRRTAMFVIHLTDSSQIPGVAEPFWLAMGADVEVVPVMNQEEFEKAGPSIAAAAKKY